MLDEMGWMYVMNVCVNKVMCAFSFLLWFFLLFAVPVTFGKPGCPTVDSVFAVLFWLSLKSAFPQRRMFRSEGPAPCVASPAALFAFLSLPSWGVNRAAGVISFRDFLLGAVTNKTESNVSGHKFFSKNKFRQLFHNKKIKKKRWEWTLVDWIKQNLLLYHSLDCDMRYIYNYSLLQIIVLLGLLLAQELICNNEFDTQMQSIEWGGGTFGKLWVAICNDVPRKLCKWRKGGIWWNL